MNTLSLIAQKAAYDFMWLIPFLILFTIWYLLPVKKKKDDIHEEGVIDLYHHQSRELYCTAESCRILTKEEAEEIREAKKSNRLIRVRFVKPEEGKTANVWNDDKQTIVYGYQYNLI